MQWPFQQIWKDEDVYIIGGGSSVSHFPVSRLQSEHVIGCNNAYLFGTAIVDLLFFGDLKWYQYHMQHSLLQFFKNPKISNHISMKDVDGVIYCPRETEGFHKHAIGWNGNTGSAAINLALVLGANRIYLVGFDMGLDDNGASNWHVNTLDTPTQEHYDRYIDVMKKTVADIVVNFPGVKIINLNPESKLDIFPKQDWTEIFVTKKEKKNENEK